MQGEEKAILVLQCAVRCGAARRVLRREREWREEDQRWRQALRRRRQRIERLERELRHVENLPALDVDRYAATARYGIKGAVAAVQTIQGFWRARQRRRRRLQKEQERRDRAARALQKFFKKYPKLRKKRCAASCARPCWCPCECASAPQTPSKFCAMFDAPCLHLPSLARLRDNLKSKEATPKKRGSIGDRARDETPWELPSVQVGCEWLLSGKVRIICCADC
jgi:DNA repair exonuclease SbcCD ATPase subunit